MLLRTKKMKQYKLYTKEKNVIGKVEDFYFDDFSWVIRYIIIDRGNMFQEQTIPISPSSVQKKGYDDKVLYTDFSEKEVRELPTINTEKPFSENIEKKLSQQFGWTAYWTVLKTRMKDLSRLISEPIKEKTEQNDTYSLRSAKELIGYQVDALDGTLGDVKDFLLDDENWKIRFLIADTRIIVPDKDILLVPERIDSIDWDQSKVKLDVTRDTIKNDPEYNSKYN